MFLYQVGSKYVIVHSTILHERYSYKITRPILLQKPHAPLVCVTNSVWPWPPFVQELLFYFNEKIVKKEQLFLSGLNVSRVTEKMLKMNQVKRINKFENFLYKYLKETPSVGKSYTSCFIRPSGCRRILLEYTILLLVGYPTGDCFINQC